MKIYASIENNLIQRISTIKEDSTFEEYEVSDPDFFNNYHFFTATSDKKLVLNPEFRKLSDNEYIVVQFGDNLTLVKPFIEHKDAIFVTFSSNEEYDFTLRHLNHYFKVDPITKSLVEDTDKKSDYQRIFQLEEFRKYREAAFKKWDIIKTNSLIGLADPLTQQEKDWYLSMLSFPENITKDSTPETWPVCPLRFQ